METIKLIGPVGKKPEVVPKCPDCAAALSQLAIADRLAEAVILNRLVLPEGIVNIAAAYLEGKGKS